ncbi:CsbD family protein [Nonomuraea basaltis]|nr:CsbD family protein [Nonomuraea basaltis]
MTRKDKATGKAKERVGDITGDKSLQAKGKVEKVKANLKQATEKVKGVFKK